MSAMNPKPRPPEYSAHYALSTEGGRIGLMACLRCGATIMLSDEYAQAIHDAWHIRHD